jgi:RND family efflux transporter MFP subunit
VITAVGAEAGQNVTPGQLVVRLARPGDKDAVFSIAETAIGDRAEHTAVLVWPLSSPDLLVDGIVREISPVADPTTRTYSVKVTLKDPPPQVRFGMSIGGRWKGSAVPVVALPLSAVFEKNGAPAVWVFDQGSGSVALRPITVARYEADTVIIADGIATGDIIVTAGVNMLREKQKVRLAMPAFMAGNP